jgi:hypothetical protein
MYFLLIAKLLFFHRLVFFLCSTYQEQLTHKVSQFYHHYLFSYGINKVHYLITFQKIEKEKTSFTFFVSARSSRRWRPSCGLGLAASSPSLSLLLARAGPALRPWPRPSRPGLLSPLPLLCSRHPWRWRPDRPEFADSELSDKAKDTAELTSPFYTPWNPLPFLLRPIRGTPTSVAVWWSSAMRARLTTPPPATLQAPTHSLGQHDHTRWLNRATTPLEHP